MVLMVKFTVGGRTFRLSAEEVVRAVEGVEPEPARGNAKYFVVINGREYPLKQVFALATGLPRIAFTSMDAYRVLSRLGFEIVERKG